VIGKVIGVLEAIDIEGDVVARIVVLVVGVCANAVDAAISDSATSEERNNFAYTYSKGLSFTSCTGLV